MDIKLVVLAYNMKTFVTKCLLWSKSLGMDLADAAQ